MKFSITTLEMHLKNAEDDLKMLKENEKRFTVSLTENAASILGVQNSIENLKLAIDLLKKHEVK